VAKEAQVAPTVKQSSGWPRPAVAALVGLLVAGAAALGGPGLGCSSSSDTTEPQAGDRTIGEYCDEVLPSFCEYAINTCDQAGTVETCIANARPICCQGACARSARQLKDIDTCVHAYAGDEAGVDEAGVEHQDLPGLSCQAVAAGLAPEPCRDLAQLLRFPRFPSPGHVE
jgi:hypothetical protein